MALKDPDRRGCEPEVPDLQEWRVVVIGRETHLSGDLRVPCYLPCLHFRHIVTDLDYTLVFPFFWSIIDLFKSVYKISFAWKYLRSQTIHLPLQVDARICCTCLFQATQFMSSSGWILAPGVIGSLELFKSQMSISDAPAPLASRFVWNGLMSRAWTQPVWFSKVLTTAAELLLDRIFS